jgi:diguanylate cyclase
MNIKPFYERLKQQHATNNLIQNEIYEMNVRRLFFVSILGIPISLVHIIVFLFKTTESEIESIWRLGIIFSHTFIVVLMLFSVFISLLILKKGYHSFYRYIQHVLISFIFFIGITITAFDQLVTTNISPYIMASLLVGLLFYLRPYKSILYFFTASLALAITLHFIIEDASILLSNQINGFTASSLGLLISVLLWQSNAKNMMQAKKIAENQKELMRTNEILDYMASHDVQTGLLNRGAFIEAAEIEINIKSRTATLMMLDLDDFKDINDQYGHPVGDQLLILLAELLTRCLSSEDFISRWGGEEFIALLPGKDLTEAYEIANHIRAKIEAEVFKIANQAFEITASFGVTEINKQMTNAFQIAYEEVDHALYQSKSKGKNRVEPSFNNLQEK